MPESRTLAMFVDFENLAIGLRDKPRSSFDINVCSTGLLKKEKSSLKKPTPIGATMKITKQIFMKPESNS